MCHHLMLLLKNPLSQPGSTWAPRQIFQNSWSHVLRHSSRPIPAIPQIPPDPSLVTAPGAWEVLIPQWGSTQDQSEGSPQISAISHYDFQGSKGAPDFCILGCWLLWCDDVYWCFMLGFNVSSLVLMWLFKAGSGDIQTSPFPTCFIFFALHSVIEHDITRQNRFDKTTQGWCRTVLLHIVEMERP